MKTRISHLWYLLSWILSTAFIVVVYHMITESDIFRFGPNVWTYIDQGYIALLGFFIILIITNIVSLIFHEVQYAFSMNYLMIRKFLPTIRFLVILVIWII